MNTMKSIRQILIFPKDIDENFEFCYNISVKRDFLDLIKGFCIWLKRIIHKHIMKKNMLIQKGYITHRKNREK